jgi:hypothetical protein
MWNIFKKKKKDVIVPNEAQTSVYTQIEVEELKPQTGTILTFDTKKPIKKTVKKKIKQPVVQKVDTPKVEITTVSFDDTEINNKLHNINSKLDDLSSIISDKFTELDTHLNTMLLQLLNGVSNEEILSSILNLKHNDNINIINEEPKIDIEQKEDIIIPIKSNDNNIAKDKIIIETSINTNNEYDLVYIVKEEEINPELVYSLRSIEKFCTFRKIWIVGHKPE